MEKFDKLKRTILNKVGGSLSPILIKNLSKMIGDDLDMPVNQRIWSGPNKSIDKVFEEVLELANSGPFKSELKNRIRLVTLGLAFGVDLDEMIGDALRDQQTMDIIHEVVTNTLENSKYNRILDNPSSDKATKLKDLAPVLQSQIDQIIHKLKNDCYEINPITGQLSGDPAVCGSTKNFLKQQQNKRLSKERNSRLESALTSGNLSAVKSQNLMSFASSLAQRRGRKATRKGRKAANKTRRSKRRGTRRS